MRMRRIDGGPESYYRSLKVGDTVTRMLAGVVPMRLTVTEVTEDRIICGAWQFHRTYGYEIDDDIGWGHPGPDGKIGTGSYLLNPERDQPASK